MIRRHLLASGVAAALSPGAAQAQRVPVVGILSWWRSAEDTGTLWPSFLDELRRLGYVDGRTIRLVYRFAAGEPAAAKAMADGLVRDKVDLIVAQATPAVLAAKAATDTIPIVFFSADPEGSGLVSNLRRPGGNVTGMSTLTVALAGKRFELLREIIPDLKRAAFLGSTRDPNGRIFADQIEQAGRSLGVDVERFLVDGPADFERVFAEVGKTATQAVIVQPIFQANRAELATLGAKYHVLLIGDQRTFAESGFPVSFGAAQEALFVRGAQYVDLILKGAKPGDLPVQQAATFHLTLNRRAANAIRITIPSSVLGRADEVIE